MASLSLIATGLGVASSVAGTAMSAAGARASGKAKAAQLAWEAAQMREKATAEQGASDRKQGQILEAGETIQSKNQAAMAASGLEATDATALEITGDVEKRTNVEGRMEKFYGAQKASDLILGAGNLMASAKNAERAGNIEALGAIVGGVSGLAKQFGGSFASSSGGSGGSAGYRPVAGGQSFGSGGVVTGGVTRSDEGGYLGRNGRFGRV